MDTDKQVTPVPTDDEIEAAIAFLDSVVPPEDWPMAYDPEEDG